MVAVFFGTVKLTNIISMLMHAKNPLRLKSSDLSIITDDRDFLNSIL